MESSVKSLRIEVARIFAEGESLSATDKAALQILAAYDGISCEDLDEITRSVEVDFAKMHNIVLTNLLSGKPAMSLIQKVALSLSIDDELLKAMFAKTEKKLRRVAQNLARGKDDDSVPEEYRGLLISKLQFQKEDLLALDEALLAAVREGKNDEVKNLIERGADVSMVVEGWRRKSLLHIAAEGDYFELAETLLRNGLSVNSRDHNSKTPLHIAARKNAVQTAEVLLKYGATLQVQSVSSKTPLHIAAKNNCVEMVRLLIEQGAVLDVFDYKKRSPLTVAVERGAFVVLQELLAAGASVHLQSEELKWSPLHYAAKIGDVNIIDLLLQNEADLDPLDEDGNTPLHIAARFGKEKAVKFLLLKKASVKSSGKKGISPLHEATAGNHPETIEALLPSINIDIKDDDGNTPIHYAAMFSAEKSAPFLLSKGANANSANGWGQTALHIAAKNSNLKIIAYLIKNGTVLEQADLAKRTPLHIAANLGVLETVVFLLKCGANVNAVDIVKNTPLHYAASANFPKVAEELLLKNADIDSVNTDKLTPLGSALENDSRDTAKLLLSKGATSYPNAQGHSLLHIAAIKNHAEMLKFLLEKNKFCDILDNEFNTPIMLAIVGGSFDAFFVLYKNGANIKQVGSNGESLLHIAAKHNRLNIAECVLNGGVSIEVRDKNGKTPLHIALENNNFEMLRFLSARGALLSVTDNAGNSLMHSAAHSENTLLAEFILQKAHNGSDVADTTAKIVDVKNKLGVTPLMFAAQYDCLETAKLLLANGASVSVRDDRSEIKVDSGAKLGEKNGGGWTPIHYAVAWNRGRILEFLQTKGVDINEKDFDDWTPLYIAVWKGHFEIVKQLVTFDAKIDLQTSGGWTALHCAAAWNRPEIAEFLINKGADINVRDNDDWTPLYTAVWNNSVETVTILVEHHADLTVKDSDGHTALDVANKSGNKKLIKVLSAT
ncbi:hypothetical protein AGMMS49938_08250 [Fibrobacterales bacterium]|nr:hypothetical protein AGMMS49938_08250 [Fibrobacterales bacterium]